MSDAFASKMSGTWARVLTAAVLIPIVVAVVLWGPSWLVAVLTAVVLVLALLEFFALGEKIGMHSYRIWILFCSLIMVAEWLVFYSYLEEDVLSVLIVMLLFLFLFGIAVATFLTQRPVSSALHSVAVSVASFLCITLPFSCVVAIRGFGPQGRILLLFTLVLVWIGDTAAYFVGRSMGRLKMAPSISPQKTWEGAVANLLGSLFVAWVFSRWLTFYSLPQLLGAAAVANIAGQIGDLLESAYKRSVGAKDSGTLLPGHGGVLDRIDALILAAPAMWCYLLFSGTDWARF